QSSRTAQQPPEPTAPAVISRTAAANVTVRAVRLSEPLHLDGVLDEPVYSSVPAIDDFIQTLPNNAAKPTERTEAWVISGNANIYVAARCWDSAPPSQWVANEMRRDSTNVGLQDNFSVMFDTFHDGRDGYTFSTSPLAVRTDAQSTHDGALLNSDWNT